MVVDVRRKKALPSRECIPRRSRLDHRLEWTGNTEHPGSAPVYNLGQSACLLPMHLSTAHSTLLVIL